ncbi:MAG: type V CRISPR-associated protein Cas12a/Cpf1, partial [Bacteroidota bacterium]|nr:type V CRISPR-associated protein Cas12a/Cpf1 [Bacteroidota bacterium]
YYLGIMDKKHNSIFKGKIERAADEDVFEKVIYKLLPGANKMLPKVFFAGSNIDVFNPSAEVFRIRNHATHSKNGEPQKGFDKGNFNLRDCHYLIDFFKDSIAKHEDWKNFNFRFSPTSSYEDLSGFYREVEQQGYKLNFQNIPSSYISELVDDGKLYLFQIYNKDFSPFSKGRPNLHTMYWKMLFDPENLKNVVYKLNGQAEVFFRTKSLDYDAKTWKEGHHAETLKGKFSYPIISNRRFALDKFQFHVPITLNFKGTGTGNLNENTLKYLLNNPDVNIIGIDRGERHLLYLTLIDQQGNIKKSVSLNDIINTYKDRNGNDVSVSTNYHDSLHKREQARDKARKSWDTIETIKELKEGYLSQVVHQVAKMMVEEKAILVMEDLNFGFKRGRQKVEKQVYQKFEKMLIDKLNYLAFKDRQPDEEGGVLKAYQLTSQLKSFKKLGKQCGFIFYVPAWNTSKIDPATGFVDFLKPKYDSEVKSRPFFEKFRSIRYNPGKQWFEFVFDYSDFTDKAEGTKTAWTVCTTRENRYRWNKMLNNNNGGQEAINVTEQLEDLFGKFGIAYGSGEELTGQITEQKGADFFRRLSSLLSTTLSLRHNNGKTGAEEEDYILSPVEPFFDSRKAGKGQPKDADANGAYHIALKGLWVLEQINQATNLRKVKMAISNMAISNKEWLRFAQGLSTSNGGKYSTGEIRKAMENLPVNKVQQ